MKKMFLLFMSVILMFSFVACSSQNSTTSSNNSSAESTTAPESSVPQNTDNNKSKSDESESVTTKNSEKTLVVYFSRTGTTKSVANEIKAQTGADIFELVPSVAYTDDYDTLLDVAQEEQKNSARPKIADTIPNFESYEVIYVGYPIWWGDMPMILYTFFDSYDMSGKTVVPFVTSGGSGFSNTISTMQSLEPNATFLEGLALGSSQANNPNSAVSDWLTKIGQK